MQFAALGLLQLIDLAIFFVIVIIGIIFLIIAGIILLIPTVTKSEHAKIVRKKALISATAKMGAHTILTAIILFIYILIGGQGYFIYH